MISKFYYFRDSQGRPMITLCRVIRNDGLIGYGWAICSSKDNPCKKIGRHISFNRAVVSLTRGNGILLDDSQHIFAWKRPIVRREAILQLGALNPLYVLTKGKSTLQLPESLRV